MKRGNEAAGRTTSRASPSEVHRRASPLTAGWGWLAVLRLGLAAAMAAYALTYRAPAGHPGPSYLLPLALAIAAVPAVMAVAQLTPRFRASRGMAMAAIPVDAAAVFATLALYAFDPRRYLLALVVLVQAEGGAVLGIRGGLAAWAVTSAGYAAIEGLSASQSGTPARPAEVAVRIGVGLILAVGGGVLSEELYGERRRRLAERERQMRGLEEAEARYRSLVEQIPAVSYVIPIEPDRPPTYVSPRIEWLTGFGPKAWTADPEFWLSRIHPDDRSRIMAERARALDAGEDFGDEYRLLSRDDRIRWVRDESTVVRDETGRPLHRQGVLIDITERKAAEEQVAFLAYHDSLTGLPNRAMFEEVLGLALARAKRYDRSVAILYMDLDNFKDVNDTLGHASGDDLLRQMAARLREAVREADAVARQGGDEFLVLLADLEPTPGGASEDPVGVAGAVARRIHDALRSPFDLSGRAVEVTASIGISLYPHTAREAGDLLKQADVAMYRSKRAASGGSVVYED